MPICCFVPGCNSGYRSCKEKHHMFKVKQGNYEQLREWKRLIPRADREFTFKDSVCDVHFDQRYIRNTYSHIINGQEVKVEMGCWRLTEDAKPTIFPNLPYYFTKKLPPQRTSPTKRKSVIALADSYKLEIKEKSGTKLKEKKKVKEKSVSLCEFSSSLVTTSVTTVLDTQMIDFDNVAVDLSPLKEKSSNTIIHNIKTLDSKHDGKPHRKNKLHNSSTKIVNLKQNIYTLRHRLKKTQTENEQLKAEISKLKSSLEEKHHLNEEWQSLPKKQQKIIQHFFRKFTGDPNGMRYDSEWILDCILLNICLDSGYEFLRRNNYLPLPSKTTLHRYINNLNADFGFDKKLFIALKMKLDQLPETERRSMTQAMIYEKARLILKELQKTPECTSDQTEECKAVQSGFTDSKVEQDKEDIIPTSKS